MVESYSINNNQIIKTVLKRNGESVSTGVNITTPVSSSLSASFDKEWLMLKDRPRLNNPSHNLRMVDLFCGTGPMSLGVIEAGRCLGIEISPVFAIDFVKDAADNYKLNFPETRVENADIHSFLDGQIGDVPSSTEIKLMEELGKIDMVIGGPPCQGFSDLNNHTRRDDPRNELIFRAVRFVELFKPRYVIIENVQGISHDKNNVLKKAEAALQELGYNLKEHLLMASRFGVAQNRRRFILVASLEPIDIDVNAFEVSTPRSVLWAIEDLNTKTFDKEDTYNSPAIHSKVNQERIKYLFDHNLYELPNELRPICQQRDDNRYTSVYGRMYPDKPAPTITSGFGSIGQGRFCHPREQRSLTPHEAARVQFIPDYFVFDKGIKRFPLQKMIGNAVPPKLTYMLALDLLR